MRQPITREVIAELRRLEAGAEIGPWIVARGEKAFNNWVLSYGYSDDDGGGEVYVTTDHLHASECRGNGALADAEFNAAIRNDAAALLDAAEWALNNGYGDQTMLPTTAKRGVELKEGSKIT